MVVTELGMAMETRPVHSWKAPRPIFVTVSGMAMEARLLQSVKACSSMLIATLSAPSRACVQTRRRVSQSQNDFLFSRQSVRRRVTIAHISRGRESSVAWRASVLVSGTRAACCSSLGRLVMLTMLMISQDDHELHTAGATATLSTSIVRSPALCVCVCVHFVAVRDFVFSSIKSVRSSSRVEEIAGGLCWR